MTWWVQSTGFEPDEALETLDLFSQHFAAGHLSGPYPDLTAARHAKRPEGGSDGNQQRQGH
jgi:hypothetical protein